MTARIANSLRISASRPMRKPAMMQRRRDALARDVGDREPEPRLGDRDEVVVVAAHLVVRDASCPPGRSPGSPAPTRAGTSAGCRARSPAPSPAAAARARSRAARARSTATAACAANAASSSRWPVVIGVVEVALEVEHADRAALDHHRRGDLAARLGARRDVARVARARRARSRGSPVLATQPTMPCPICSWNASSEPSG